MHVRIWSMVHHALFRAVALAACLAPWVVVACRGSWGSNNLVQGACTQALAVVVALASHDAVSGSFAIGTVGSFTLSAIACFVMADASRLGELLVVCIGASALAPCMVSACSLGVRTRLHAGTTGLTVVAFISAAAVSSLMFGADDFGSHARVLCLCMAIVVLNSVLFDCFSSFLTKLLRVLFATTVSSAASATQVVLSHDTGFAIPSACFVFNVLYNVRTLSALRSRPSAWCAVTFGATLGVCASLGLWDDLPVVRHALPALLCVSILGRMNGCTGEMYTAYSAHEFYPAEVGWPCPSFITSFTVIGGSAIMSAIILMPRWPLPAVLACLTVTSVMNHYFPYGAARYGAVDLLDRFAVLCAGVVCTYYTMGFSSYAYSAATTGVASVTMSLYTHGTVMNTMSNRPNIAVGWQVTLHVVSAIGFVLVSIGVALDV
jgi:hypothetical protein